VLGYANWLSRDPIAERGGLNLYGYVANNPLNLVDPLGLDSATAWGFGGMSAPGAVAAGVYQQTGSSSAALQAATGLGNSSFQHQVNQAATGAAIGIAAPALAVGAVEAAPAVGAASVSAAYMTANAVLTNPEAVVAGAEFIVGAVDPNPPTGTDSAASWLGSVAGNLFNSLFPDDMDYDRDEDEDFFDDSCH
jgi:hypothetical protein